MKIYTREEGEAKEWVYTGLEGYLCLIYDRRYIRGPILRMYHPQTCYCLFECGIYYNFSQCYTKASEFFHYFPIPQGFIGFTFPDAKQADSFYKVITDPFSGVFPKSMRLDLEKEDFGVEMLWKIKRQYGVRVGKDLTVKKMQRRKTSGFKHVGGYKH